MDFLHPQVVLEPIILGDLAIEEDEQNPQSSTQFLENFRRNQLHTVNFGPHDGALVLIRTNGLHRRNFLLPAIIPNLIPSRAVIPLPEFPRVVQPESESVTIEEMGPLKGVWGCECPIPGTQPMISCTDCKKRECFEWTWDKDNSESTTVFQNNDRDVLFNPGFSVGTVAVRGSEPLRQGYHHYWEIEMSSDVYGTDMMIGVGTDKTDIRKYSHSFVSLIGLDEQSWGLSYTGSKHHNGKVLAYTKSFGQNSVIGVHCDLWSGQLEFYINRKPIGKAFTGLQGKVLYPMISSTAARSGMNLVFCRSYPPTLQLHTLLSLGKSLLLPDNVSLFKVLPDNIVPPGLKLFMKNNFWWISTSNKEPVEDKTDRIKINISPPSSVSSTPATAGSSQSSSTKRGRKSRKDDAETITPNVTTRSMARRSHISGTNPIFSPITTTECPTPAKSPRVSQRITRRHLPRSSSSPCVGDHHNLNLKAEEEKGLPPRAASSASNDPPISKRMCLRSSSRKR